MLMKTFIKEINNEFYIRSEVSVVIEGEEFLKAFDIKMFTQDMDDFEIKMEEIMSFIKLEDYSNNAIQHYQVLEQFFKE